MVSLQLFKLNHMKLKFAFLLLPLAFVLSNCNLTTKDDAIAFNDTIIDEQEKIISKVQDYNTEETYDLKVSLDLCKAIVEQCDKSIKIVKQLKAVEGGESFKASALAYFEFYKHVGDNEYVEYSNLICDEDYTDEDYEKTLEIEDYINTKTTALEERVFKDQKDFSIKYKFRLY